MSRATEILSLDRAGPQAPKLPLGFTLPGAPTAKGRPRFATFGVRGLARAYTPARTRNAEWAVSALAARHAPQVPFAGPVDVALTFETAYPRSWSAAKRADPPPHVQRPDLDNLVKLVLDALTRSGRWWADDAQVVSLRATKRYAAVSATHVEVRAAQDGAR